MVINYGTGFVQFAKRGETMKIFNLPNIKLLKQSLNVYDKQHQAIANNIAHANDENYKRLDTDFSSVLKKAADSKIKVTHHRHISIDKNQDSLSLGENKKAAGKVDYTKEMGDLAVNQIKFDFSARILRRVYEGISTSIRGRL